MLKPPNAASIKTILPLNYYKLCLTFNLAILRGKILILRGAPVNYA